MSESPPPYTHLAAMPVIAAEKFGSRIYADFLGQETSYETLQQSVAFYAALLQNAGLKKGDRVAIILPNCPAFPAAFYGVLQAGGVAVNLNPAFAPEETAYVLHDSGARFVISVNLRVVTDILETAMRRRPECKPETIFLEDFPSFLNRTKGMLFKTLRGKALFRPDKKNTLYRMIPSCGRAAVFTPAPDMIAVEDDIAMLQYTGGTTGHPKGAAITHAALFANAAQCAERMDGCGGEMQTIAGVLPFFHIFAMTAVLQVSLLMGYRIIMYPRPDVALLIKDLGAKRISILPAVPALFLRLLNHKLFLHADFSYITFCVSGGAPLPETLLQRFEQKTETFIAEGYGLTEASPVLAFNAPLKEQRRPGSVGLPLKDTCIEIVAYNEDDGDALSVREIGEIRATGPQMMKHYHGVAAIEERPFDVRGRLRTGDSGYLDEDGYLYVVDRYKDVVLYNGFNVYPRQTEEALSQYPGVIECAVFGLPSEDTGMSVAAAIAVAEGENIDVDHIRAFLGEHISYYKIPSDIRIIGALPKTPIGKPDKKALKQLFLTHAPTS